MTTSTAQATPAIPPRPSRGSDKDSSSSSGPRIPPRPSKKRSDRSASPSSDRFAQSPFNDGIIAKNKPSRLLSPHYGSPDINNDPIERAGSVPMPSVGEEGMEYSAVADELEEYSSNPASPELTKTVAADLKLYAPKPSLPASSAKQRVAAVTRTDSDRAASFGIGRSQPEERALSRDGIKKKPSTSFSTTSDHGQHTDDEHGIPEIGQRVPMNPNLGDVQAPSPAPSEGARHHSRKHSSRGLPPGSYGLHGHGVAPLDKLDKAYYQKHPELIKREEHTPIHDRQNDYAMSSADLNRLVRDTASRGSGLGTNPEIPGTPTDEVAFQASDEYTTRFSSSRPASRARKSGEHRRSTSLAKTISNVSQPEIVEPIQQEEEESDDEPIHVDDPKHPQYRSPGDEDPAANGEDHEYTAPILAADERIKDPTAYLQQPAVHPPPERRGSAFEMDDAPSRPISRPSSIHHTNSQPEIYQTPLEDVEEYEPLFPEDEKEKEKRRQVELADENKHHNHFPSKDIWEDAPSSVHYTATVSTPDLPETDHHRARSSGHHEDRSMTPAHLFAKHQEELAEKEAKRHPAGSFMSLTEDRPNWAAHQAHLKVERPSSGQRFPSRDIWEDVPESQLQQATVSSSPTAESKPELPARPTKKTSIDSVEKPMVPSRPKPRQGSGDDKSKPPVSDKPKPQLPSRPAKSPSVEFKDEEAPKSKPPVPKRPAGGKIAALQAGFMNDLNQRLQLGPQGPKKEEPSEQETIEEEKEKAPLLDARKGRARGPQRRAPAKSPVATSEAPRASVSTLTLSLSQSAWSIDPEYGNVVVGGEEEAEQPLEKSVEQTPAAEEVENTEVPDETTVEQDQAADLIGSPATEAKTGVEDAKPETEEEPVKLEKTLVANTAGESILETTVEKKDGGNEVEPVTVDDTVKA